MLESSATASPSSTIAAAARAIACLRSTSSRSRKSNPSSDWPRSSGADAAADARDEALARELREVAPDRDLRNRERFRKFRNVDGVTRLEHPQDLLHPLLLRQIGHVGATARRPYSGFAPVVNRFRNERIRK